MLTCLGNPAVRVAHLPSELAAVRVCADLNGQFARGIRFHAGHYGMVVPLHGIRQARAAPSIAGRRWSRGGACPTYRVQADAVGDLDPECVYAFFGKTSSSEPSAGGARDTPSATKAARIQNR
jgi:hypothetical protein